MRIFNLHLTVLNQDPQRIKVWNYIRMPTHLKIPVFVPSFSFILNIHTLLLFKIYIIKEEMFPTIVGRENKCCFVLVG